MTATIDPNSPTWACVKAFLTTQRQDAARNLRVDKADPAGPRAKLDLLDELEKLAGKPDLGPSEVGGLEGSSLAMD